MIWPLLLAHKWALEEGILRLSALLSRVGAIVPVNCVCRFERPEDDFESVHSLQVSRERLEENILGTSILRT